MSQTHGTKEHLDDLSLGMAVAIRKLPLANGLVGATLSSRGFLMQALPAPFDREGAPTASGGNVAWSLNPKAARSSVISPKRGITSRP